MTENKFPLVIVWVQHEEHRKYAPMFNSEMPKSSAWTPLKCTSLNHPEFWQILVQTPSPHDSG